MTQLTSSNSTWSAGLKAKQIDVSGEAKYQLDLWPSGVRAIPNDYARSALFTVRNKTVDRRELDNSPIFHIEQTIKITYSGTELRADDDELVWQQLLDYAKQQLLDYGKHQPLTEAFSFNLHQLCKDVGWAVNGRNYKRLEKCIERLMKTVLKVTNERTGRASAVSLIEKFEVYDKTKYEMWMDPRIRKLFERQAATWIEWERYRDLKPVERRLYDYFASHKHPFALTLAKFHQLCASDCTSDKKWREIVRSACTGLVEAGLVVKAWVADDKVFCERHGA